MSGSGAELLFDVLTPIGFHVHVTREYWELIVRSSIRQWWDEKPIFKKR